MVWWKIWKKNLLNPASFSSCWWKSSLKASAILVRVIKVFLSKQHRRETEPINLGVRHFSERRMPKQGISQSHTPWRITPLWLSRGVFCCSYESPLWCDSAWHMKSGQKAGPVWKSLVLLRGGGSVCLFSLLANCCISGSAELQSGL